MEIHFGMLLTKVKRCIEWNVWTIFKAPNKMVHQGNTNRSKSPTGNYLFQGFSRVLIENHISVVPGILAMDSLQWKDKVHRSKGYCSTLISSQKSATFPLMTLEYENEAKIDGSVYHDLIM